MGLDWESLRAGFLRLDHMGHGLGYGKKGPGEGCCRLPDVTR